MGMGPMMMPAMYQLPHGAMSPMGPHGMPGPPGALPVRTNSLSMSEAGMGPGREGGR